MTANSWYLWCSFVSLYLQLPVSVSHPTCYYRNQSEVENIYFIKPSKFTHIDTVHVWWHCMVQCWDLPVDSFSSEDALADIFSNSRRSSLLNFLQLNNLWVAVSVSELIKLGSSGKFKMQMHPTLAASNVFLRTYLHESFKWLCSSGM